MTASSVWQTISEMSNVQSDTLIEAAEFYMLTRRTSLKRRFEIEEARGSLSEHVKQLIRQIVRLEMIDFDNCSIFGEDDPVWLDKPKISDYYKNCRAELTAMKNHEFEGTSLTYVAVLKIPLDLYTLDADNAHVAKEIETKNYETLYPIYAPRLRAKFDEAVAYKTAKKKNDVSKLREFFRKIFEEADEYEIAFNLETAVEKMAKYEAEMDRPVFDEHKDLLSVLEMQPGLLSHYAKCRAELTAMKSHRFEGTLVTYYAFMKESVDVLARYVRNDRVVEEFEAKDYEKLYPIYAESLEIFFDDAVARQKAMEEVSTVLSAIMQFAAPDHVAFEVIFQYLSSEDVERITNIEIGFPERYLTNY